MSQLIKDAVLGYANVLEVVKERAPIFAHAISIKEIEEWANKRPGGVKNLQQVIDACKTYVAKNYFGKTVITHNGKRVALYWLKPTSEWLTVPIKRIRKSQTEAGYQRGKVTGHLNVQKVLERHSSATSPILMTEVEAIASKFEGGVLNTTQVKNVLNKFHAQGLVSKIKEGRHVRYWWTSNTSDLHLRPDTIKPVITVVPKEDAPLGIQTSTGGESVNQAEPKVKLKTMESKPDIIVTKERVVIVTQQCKITVEF